MKNILLLILPVICTCNVMAQDSAWKLLGNAGTTNANFIGTTDNRPLFFRVNNIASGRIEPGVNSNSTGEKTSIRIQWCRCTEK